MERQKNNKYQSETYKNSNMSSRVACVIHHVSREPYKMYDNGESLQLQLLTKSIVYNTDKRMYVVVNTPNQNQAKDERETRNVSRERAEITWQLICR